MTREAKVELLLDSIMAHLLLQHKTEPTRESFRKAINALLEGQDKTEIKPLESGMPSSKAALENMENPHLKVSESLSQIKTIISNVASTDHHREQLYNLAYWAIPVAELHQEIVDAVYNPPSCNTDDFWEKMHRIRHKLEALEGIPKI